MAKSLYTDVDLCAECGGKCCTTYAGVALPEDFSKPLLDSLVQAFRSGKWVIDWWEGYEDGKGYFIRPAHKNTKELYDASWGGVCVFHSPTGCALSSDERPAGCRLLEPKKDEQCVSHPGAGKKEGADAWLEYEDLIEEAARQALATQ